LSVRWRTSLRGGQAARPARHELPADHKRIIAFLAQESTASIDE